MKNKVGRPRKPNYEYAHAHRVTRKYNIKDDNFIRYVVSSIKSVSHEEASWRLDSYELYALRDTAKWARTADLEEIIVIMTKLGFPMYLNGYAANMPHKGSAMLKWKNDFIKKKDINGLLEQISQHKYFCIAGRDWMKAQGLFSQVVNGATYVVNKDYKNFLKHGMNAEGFADLKNVDIAFGVAFLLRGYENLDDTDLAILYLCKRYDDLPLSGNYIYEVMEYRRQSDLIQRHIGKLTKGSYLYRHGSKKNSTYSLTDKGMLILNKARKAFFQDCQFWNKEPQKPIDKNGSSTSSSIEQKANA